MLVLVGPKNFKKVKDNVWVSQQISDEVEIAMSHKKTKSMQLQSRDVRKALYD